MFGCIPPSGLGGDSETDKWTDDGRTDRRTYRKLMLLLHILTVKGSDVASLVGFRPVVGGDSMTDGRTDGWRL